MSGGHNYSGGSSSEASKLLEAALEQMDGIIQGARFELPNYGPASGKQTPLTLYLTSGVNFTIMFMQSFHSCRSQKREKTVKWPVSFCKALVKSPSGVLKQWLGIVHKWVSIHVMLL